MNHACHVMNYVIYQMFLWATRVEAWQVAFHLLYRPHLSTANWKVTDNSNTQASIADWALNNPFRSQTSNSVAITEITPWFGVFTGSESHCIMVETEPYPVDLQARL